MCEMKDLESVAARQECDTHASYKNDGMLKPKQACIETNTVVTMRVRHIFI